MVHGLLLAEFADRGQHSKGITAQEDEIFGVRSDAGDPGIADVVDRIRGTRVLCHSTAAHKPRSCSYQGHHLKSHGMLTCVVCDTDESTIQRE